MKAMMTRKHVFAAAVGALLAFTGVRPALAAEARFTNLEATGEILIDVTNKTTVQLEVVSPAPSAYFLPFVEVSAELDGVPLPAPTLVDTLEDAVPSGTVALYHVDLSGQCPTGGAKALVARAKLFDGVFVATASRFVGCN